MKGKHQTGPRHYRTVKAKDTIALKRWRKELGFNQVELAEKAGVYDGAVQRLEQGDNISYPLAESIAQALNQPMQDLFVAAAGASLSNIGRAKDAASTPALSRTRARSVSVPDDDAWAAERTYFRYRDEPCPLVESPELVRHLEARYRSTALSFGKRLVPVTAIWKNATDLIHPDKILGHLDFTAPIPLTESTVFTPAEYTRAREFIKRQYGSGRIRYDGCEYRMTGIDSACCPPRIAGAFGLYYDSILTQYALEWELKKALLRGGPSSISSLFTSGTLPLREAIEAEGNPILSGHSRCAALSISTLVVFKRSIGGFSCLIRRRSMEVGVSPGVLHVVPAAMFEASNTNDPWSIEFNVWRELLEEVYDDEDLQGSGYAEILDHVRGKEPVRLLCQLIQNGGAEFSVTGIVSDLLCVRPEICTILFVRDPAFVEARRMRVSWEYEPELRTGKFVVPWDRVDEVIASDGAKYGIAPGATACIAFGREWMKHRHRM